MKSVALHNLGCKVNAYEMDVMQQMLQEKGYNIVSFDERADIYIVNTCSVTNIADRKSRQMLHKAKKENPEAIVVATGCYVQTGQETLEMDDSVDLAIGNNRKKDIISILEAYMRQEDVLDNVIDINQTSEYEEMQLKQTAGHTRAYIKIQDGCNQFCSYCIIPYARGRVRSRSVENIITEVKELVASGFKEVVLTGIHISSYGIDFVKKEIEGGIIEAQNAKADYRKIAYEKEYLLKLIQEISGIDGLERIRIGSLEPRVITREFAKGLSEISKICPHFHLSLQSGCDATLKRMNRHYSGEEYKNTVQILREYFVHPAITTDVIVGFPGETEEEFLETKRYVEEIEFYEMHIFKFSKRQGTVAAEMKEQIDDKVKTNRSNVLLDLEKEHSKNFREFYVGKEVEVLFEETKTIQGKQYEIGHTKEYVKVAYAGENTLENQMKTGKIVGFLTDEILCME